MKKTVRLSAKTTGITEEAGPDYHYTIFEVDGFYLLGDQHLTGSEKQRVMYALEGIDIEIEKDKSTLSNYTTEELMHEVIKRGSEGEKE